jgi:hypothetical protein
MHISELRKRSQQQIMGGDWDVPFALIDWLEQNGFAEVGKGYFSKVYAQPNSNKIIKLLGVNNPSVTKCGIDFAQFQRRANNRHFPKVFAIKTYKAGGYQRPSYGMDDEPPRTEKPLTIIIMENIPLSFEAARIRWKRDKEYNMGLMSFLLAKDIISPMDIKANQQYFPDDWKMRIGGPMSNEDINQAEKEWLAQYRSRDPLANAIATVYELVRKHECEFADFKLANTRMRKDGTIVLIDALPF